MSSSTFVVLGKWLTAGKFASPLLHLNRFTSVVLRHRFISRRGWPFWQISSITVVEAGPVLVANIEQHHQLAKLAILANIEHTVVEAGQSIGKCRASQLEKSGFWSDGVGDEGLQYV